MKYLRLAEPLVKPTGDWPEHLDESSEECAKRWTPALKHKLSVRDALKDLARETEDPRVWRRAVRINDCNRALVAGVRIVEDKHATAIKHGKLCRVRACIDCVRADSMKRRQRALEALPKILEDNPKTTFLFLTLTVRNCRVEDLGETIRAMSQGWRYFTFRNWHALGYIKALEVTRNADDNSAHPHLHCLLHMRESWFSKHYLSQAAWTEKWRKAMQLDYQPIIDVRRVRGDPTEIVPELIKYATKVDDLMAPGVSKWLATASLQMHGARHIVTGGTCKSMFKKTKGDGQEKFEFKAEAEYERMPSRPRFKKTKDL